MGKLGELLLGSLVVSEFYFWLAIVACNVRKPGKNVSSCYYYTPENNVEQRRKTWERERKREKRRRTVYEFRSHLAALTSTLKLPLLPLLRARALQSGPVKLTHKVKSLKKSFFLGKY